ncbi:HAD-IA family hydrolase [Novipirellula caenicola]|uniref:Fructose-1-phosphate phosphatase YqaB n=1 Tax=Novipirellula caenicola TaxID=1536901 RepID=A0ABP9VSU9_9BACT
MPLPESTTDKQVDDLSRYGGLIFDCDGTLTDSMPLHFEAWRETMARFGIEFTEQRFYSMAGMPTDKIIRVLAEEQSVDVDPEVAGAEKEQAFRQRIPRLQPLKRVCDIAHAHFNVVPMAVASGGDREGVWAQIKHLQMESLFAAVVTAEDTEKHKPEPDVFLKAAELLKVPPATCLVFEDSPLGLDAAARASMDCVDVRDFTFYEAGRA